MTLTLDVLAEKHKVIPRFVVDVGGYKGNYADIIHKKFNCEIVIYEPIKKYYSMIVERFKADRNIHTVPMAVGKENGMRKMYVSEASTSFFRQWNNSSITEEVPTIRLSDEIKEKEVDILKLNCEGAEYEILDDLSEHDLIKDIKEIVIQFHKIQSKEKYEELLSKTHEKVFDFKWQLWIKKYGELQHN